MIARILTFTISACFLLAANLPGQELSTSVFPSEDELYEAFRLGEISYDQYSRLQEIISHGVDSISNHLLDEIPNLLFFRVPGGRPGQSLRTPLEQDQKTPFMKKALRDGPARRRLRGIVKHRYYRYLQEDGRSKYQSTLSLRLNDHLSAEARLHREFSGRERVISRAFAYTKSSGFIREIRLGSFSKRLALGTVLGYRGKLFDYSPELDSESLLFPDYGGFNGACGHFRYGRLDLQPLVSVNRDADHRLVTAGMMLLVNGRRFSPGVVIGLNRLENRVDGQSVADYKLGLYSHYDYGNGYASGEFSWQVGEKSSPAGFVAEGRHRIRMAEIRYSAWTYADDYIDLSGGSKAANIRHANHLETVDFEYSDKRSGQSGALFKTIVDLVEKTALSNSLIYARTNADTVDTQWLTGLTRRFSRRFSLTANYLRKSRKRSRMGAETDNAYHRTRIEARLVGEDFYLRCNLAYTAATRRDDYVSVFVGMRYRSDSHGRFEIWSNLARVDPGSGRVDYWYWFAKNEVYLSSSLSVSVKLSNTYRRDSEDKHLTLASYEVKLLL